MFVSITMLVQLTADYTAWRRRRAPTPAINFLWEFTITKNLLMIAGDSWAVCLSVCELCDEEGIADWKRPFKCENRCISFSTERSLFVQYMYV